MNQTQANHSASPQKVDPFGGLDLAAIARDTQAARVILRAVNLAVHAEETGSISRTISAGASRWSAAISAAMDRLDSVRDALMESSGASQIDWFTSHALVSALDCALWDGYCTSAKTLTHEEIIVFTQVTIDALDVMLTECDAAAGAVAAVACVGGMQ